MKKGFTLIELLVVVLIIGILASIALPQYTKAVEKSRSVEAVLTLKNIEDAANRYYLAKGDYRGSAGGNLRPDDLDIDIPGSTETVFGGKDYNFLVSGLAVDGQTTYLYATPKGKTFSSGNYFQLVYTLKNGEAATKKCTDNKSFALCKSFFGATDCDSSYCQIK
ncbi:prepilin-type N-terminal cleavage/methylation domain-containing protein [Elusimicrobium posterum]|uniref:type IV pilin protein n=1 Tax=Elusimicrobium posterum TaxID=3116653 RepID=UPI003C773078